METREICSSNASSLCHTNNSLKTDKCMTAIPTKCAVNQISEYKDSYAVIKVIYLSFFKLLFVSVTD